MKHTKVGGLKETSKLAILIFIKAIIKLLFKHSSMHYDVQCKIAMLSSAKYLRCEALLLGKWPLIFWPVWVMSNTQGYWGQFILKASVYCHDQNQHICRQRLSQSPWKCKFVSATMFWQIRLCKTIWQIHFGNNIWLFGPRSQSVILSALLVEIVNLVVKQKKSHAIFRFFRILSRRRQKQQQPQRQLLWWTVPRRLQQQRTWLPPRRWCLPQRMLLRRRHYEQEFVASNQRHQRIREEKWVSPE